MSLVQGELVRSHVPTLQVLVLLLELSHCFSLLTPVVHSPIDVFCLTRLFALFNFSLLTHTHHVIIDHLQLLIALAPLLERCYLHIKFAVTFDIHYG